MGRRTIERRLKDVAKRLRSLRDELRIIDEQLLSLVDDAEDAGIRALVSENTGDAAESRRASAHVESMRAHRVQVVSRIADLEARQDSLLDDLNRS